MFKKLFSTVASALGGSPGSPTEVYELRGLQVVVENTRPDIATADVLERLDDALGLIAQYAPTHWSHLRRDVRQISVVRFPCRGAYFPQDRVIVTELTFLARRDISAAPVAASILHEGVHARVDCMGVRHEGRDRAKEERLCRQAELAFGRSLPPELGAPVVERALESLALDDHDVAPTVDWAEAQARQAAVDREARRA